MIKKLLFILLLFLSALLTVNRCDSNITNTSTNTTKEDPAFLTIALTDDPAPYDSVVILFSEINANINSVWYYLRQEPARINLLEWSNGRSTTLAFSEVPVGECSQIRIKIDSAFVGVDGQVHELKVPSGTTTGIKLDAVFTIKEGVNYKIILDFDADKSVVILGSEEKPKGYILKPQIRVILDSDVGSISGTVLNPELRPFAYAISGEDTITSTKVDTTSGYFKLAYLPADYYTVLIEDTDGREYTQRSVAVQIKQDKYLGEITLDD